MKKYLALLLMMALAAAPGALAQEAATPLPYGVSFDMDGQAVADAIGDGAVFAPYFEDDEEVGSISLDGGIALGLGGLQANYVTFEVARNNSPEEPRLYLISAGLPVSGNGVKEFRDALDALKALYGEPDNDPFDESGVECYVEYGTLSATWSKADARINLSMGRMYGAYLSLDFTSRLCYDAADLQ